MNLFDKYHGNRIWHINGNIILAGVISTLAVAVIVHLSDIWMLHDIWFVVAFTAIVDIILDPMIFFLLHYKSSTHNMKEFKKEYFIKDAVRIQGHRIVLSFVYYGMAVSLQTFFLMHKIGMVESVVLAYLIALIATRIIHTFYGIKSGLFN